MSFGRLHVTKGALGESYIVGTGFVLGLVLVWQLSLGGLDSLVLAALGFLPVVVLVASVRWVGRLGLESDQVWTVAEFSAVALGTAVASLFVLDVLAPAAFSSADTFLLASTLATITATGTLVGIVLELRRTNRRLGVRNTVLHRVLRHNVRNDMTVLLCLLDELEVTADARQRETLDRARGKIYELVDMTDKVRQVNVTVNERATGRGPVDLAALVEHRVERLRESYPGVDIETDLPETAPARVSDQFGLVLDNVVQSAAGRSGDAELRVVVATEARTVELRIEDRTESIPEPDLAALVSRTETDLEHGFGVELWLVYWLVDASDGEIAVDTDDGVRRVEIRVDRATEGLLPATLP